MAENVSITPGSGNIIAADEVTDGTLGTAKVQYVKIMDGAISGTSKAAVGANGLKVDGSGATQPVSGSVTVTQATGTNLHTVLDSGTLTSITNALPAGTNVIGHVIADTGSTTAVTQATGTNLHTVVDSGTVTANAGTNLNTSALALDATVAKLTLAQGSTTSGETGPLMMGAVTTATPSYSTSQTSPLSLSTAGGLRTNPTGSLGTTSASFSNNGNISYANNDGGNPAALFVVNSFSGGNFSGTTSAAKQWVTVARTPTIFKTVSVAATATGNTAVWTPASSNKFRLLGYQITAQGLSATASAAVTVSFQDSASGITFGTYDVDVPAVASVVSGVNQISGGFVNMGAFGIISAVANNVLNFNISAAGAGTVGTYRVNVYGTEE